MLGKGRGRSGDSDPDLFEGVLAPPPGETEESRKVRLAEEQAAKARSDEIDKELAEERMARKLRKQVKILLLGEPLSRRFPSTDHSCSGIGQSESGVSVRLTSISMFIDTS